MNRKILILEKAIIFHIENSKTDVRKTGLIGQIFNVACLDTHEDIQGKVPSIFLVHKQLQMNHFSESEIDD